MSGVSGGDRTSGGTPFSRKFLKGLARLLSGVSAVLSVRVIVGPRHVTSPALFQASSGGLSAVVFSKNGGRVQRDGGSFFRLAAEPGECDLVVEGAQRSTFAALGLSDIAAQR